MDCSILGVGCGFDTLGKDKIMINSPTGTAELVDYEDTREGWIYAT
jgi:hypothetical protein